MGKPINEALSTLQTVNALAKAVSTEIKVSGTISSTAQSTSGPITKGTTSPDGKTRPLS